MYTCTRYVTVCVHVHVRITFRQLASQDPCWLRLETPIGIGFSLCLQETKITHGADKTQLQLDLLLCCAE